MPTKPERAQRLVELDDDAAHTLKTFGSTASIHADALVDAMYAYLEAHHETRERLPDAGRIGHVRSAQARYFTELFAGDYGEVYATRRAQVGVIHERIGLPIDLQIATYARYLRQLVQLAIATCQVEQLAPTLDAMIRVLFFDLMLVLDAWIAARELERDEARRALVTAERLGAVGLLAAGAAHDLASPLTVIGLVSTSLRERLGATVAPELDDLDRALEIATGIGRQLLTVAHPCRAAETSDVVEAASTAIAIACKRSSRVRVRNQARPMRARIGRLALVQVLTNLVRNGMDALDGAGIDGEVAVAADHDGAMLWIDVSDSGPGFAPEARARLFEPFASTKGDGGTGLGLVVVRHLIDGANGTIAVEDRAGGGTRVRVTLPLA